MRRISGAIVLCVVLAGVSCVRGRVAPALEDDRSSPSVWVVDLVRTLPGRQAEYLRGIESNWGNARRLARASGTVRSYQAFSATPDSARGWDVMLLTEYADSRAFADRERVFQEIFALPEYLAGRVTGRPSAELRVIAASEVGLRVVTGSGAPR